MNLLINPIAFNLGFTQVHWYGIILGTGALLGLLIVIREGKRYGIIPDFFMDMLMITLPSAIIGARIYFVAFKWADYRNNLGEIFAVWHGGIAIYGALIGAVISAYLYFRAKGYSFWRLADICAPGLLVGQILGRWGNFMNQEAHGGPVQESFLRLTLHLPNFIVNQMNIEGIFYHPTFLYESSWNIVGLLLLLWIRRRSFVRSGELFIGYLMWYSIGRFYVEGLRTDSLSFIAPNWLANIMNAIWSPMKLLFTAGADADGNVRISQLLSVIIVIIGIAFIYYRRKSGISIARYTDPIVSSKAPATTETANNEAITAINE